MVRSINDRLLHGFIRVGDRTVHLSLSGYFLDERTADIFEVLQCLGDLQVQRPAEGAFFDQIAPWVIAELYYLNSSSCEELIRVFIEEQQTDIARKLVVVDTLSDCQPSVKLLVIKLARAVGEVATDIVQKPTNQSGGQILDAGLRIDAVIKRNLRSRFHQLPEEIAARLDGLRALPNEVVTGAPLLVAILRRLVGSIVTARRPEDD